MTTRPQLPMIAAAGIWLVSVIGFGLLGLAVLGAVYDGFLDCAAGASIAGPAVSSANTAPGWAVAVFASLMPLGIAYAVTADRARAAMLTIAVLVGGLELWVWWWIISPVCQTG